MIPRVYRFARATVTTYHQATSPNTCSHLDFLEKNSQQEREQCHTHFLEEEDVGWHPMLTATHMRYTQYCRSIKVHWLTKLFMEQSLLLKDEDCTILLIEMAEIKEELMELEGLHQLGD